jgi:hypothetical protein
MVRETVDVEIVEADGTAFAQVEARFEMFNPAPERELLVGFPAQAMDVLSEELGQVTYSPAWFSPESIVQLWVEAGGQAYPVRETRVSSGPYEGTTWFLWSMRYPTGRTDVRVVYRQRLARFGGPHPPYVSVKYVLRTGAFWDGPIEEAVITLRTSAGGRFVGGPEVIGRRGVGGLPATVPEEALVLGPDGAVEAAPTRLVWRLTDFEPTADVGATYLLADTWQRLVERRAALDRPGAGADAYHAAALAVLELLGRQDERYAPSSVYQSRGVYQRFFPAGREWARRGVEAEPLDGEARVTLGDFLGYPFRQAYLRCWPRAAVAEYERGAALGSGLALERLIELEREVGESELEPCASPDEAAH